MTGDPPPPPPTPRALFSTFFSIAISGFGGTLPFARCTLVERHGWLSVSASEELIFETPTKDRWPRAFATAGVDVRLLAPTSGHA